MSTTGSGGHTRVMLVDDHAIVREGYRSLLQKQDRLRVVAEANDGAEAYRIYKEVRPDLVIMDLSMPGIGGVEAIRRIRQWDKSLRILVFTMHQSAAYAVQAIKAGARGFVTKSSPPDGAAARHRRGHGRAHRAQPRHRPRTRHEPARQ